MSNKLYSVMAVDRAGTPWQVALAPAREALEILEKERVTTPNSVCVYYWVCDPDEPERGDVQTRLEDEIFCEDDQSPQVEN
jgi:hypothetical protein